MERYNDLRYTGSQANPRFATVWALHVCELTSDEADALTADLEHFLPRVFTGEYALVDHEDWGQDPSPDGTQQMMLIARTGSWDAVKGPKNRSAAEAHVRKAALRTIGREPVLDWSTAGDWSAGAEVPTG